MYWIRIPSGLQRARWPLFRTKLKHRDSAAPRLILYASAGWWLGVFQGVICTVIPGFYYYVAAMLNIADLFGIATLTFGLAAGGFSLIRVLNARHSVRAAQNEKSRQNQRTLAEVSW